MENVIDISGRVNENLKDIARCVAQSVLKLMNQPLGLEVAITFVSGNEIQKINAEFRNVDKITDVLSFPATNLKAGELLDVNLPDIPFLKNEAGLIHFGDIAVCSKKIREQAKDFGVTPEAELKKLIIHSMLHLMGYDHIKDDDKVEMRKKEEKILTVLKITRD